VLYSPAGRFPEDVGVAFVGLCYSLLLFRVTNELLLAQLGQNALWICGMQLCRKILGIPLRNLEELGPHRIMTVLTRTCRYNRRGDSNAYYLPSMRRSFSLA